MITSTKVKIDVPDDFNIYGQVTGNEKSGKVIIFSHGFGVKRDNKGIFTDLVNVLANDYLMVQFDYQIIHQDGDSMQVPPFHDSAKRLQNVVNWVKEKYSPKEINVIAHSAGCYIAALANIEGIKKSVLISVPPKGSGYKSLVYDLEERGKCKVNLDGLTKLQKSDGSTRYLSKEFWDSFKKMEPEVKLYEQYSKKSEVYFIRAMNEDVIAWGDYSPVKEIAESRYKELPGNHNFTGRERVALLEYITTIF